MRGSVVVGSVVSLGLGWVGFLLALFSSVVHPFLAVQAAFMQCTNSGA